jgi:hypothetical protein
MVLPAMQNIVRRRALDGTRRRQGLLTMRYWLGVAAGAWVEAVVPGRE